MAQRQKKPVLKILDNGQTVESVALGSGIIIIGREEADLVLEDVEVSTTHCQVQLIAGEYHVFDLNSTNGTFVNGQRIAKSRLASGDRIRVGRTEFHFFLEEELGADVASTPLNLDPDTLPVPSSEVGSALDALIVAEKKRYLDSLQLVADVSYHDGQKEVLISSQEILVGRSSSMGRFHLDEELSRRHARLFVGLDGFAWIEDLGSTNGIAVNGDKVGAPQRLLAEDVVKAGRAKIKVSCRPGPEYSFS